MPIYTDPQGPARISRELWNLPREVRFQQWHVRLHAIETEYKFRTDLGRGLMVAGLAMWFVPWLWRFGGGSEAWLLFVWLGLWLLRIPLTFWYYSVRQDRFEYPVWGDSVGIRIFTESISYVIGGVVTLLILLGLLAGRNLTESGEFQRPSSLWGWIRAIVLSLWIALLVWLVGESVWFGDEGAVISGVLAVPILLKVLSARPVLSTKPTVALSGSQGGETMEVTGE